MKYLNTSAFALFAMMAANAAIADQPGASSGSQASIVGCTNSNENAANRAIANNGNGKSHLGDNCQDDYNSAEKEVEIPPWVIASIDQLDNESDLITYDGDGDPENLEFTAAELTVSANADHVVYVQFTAVERGKDCVPFFAPQQGEATEADGILGRITLLNEDGDTVALADADDDSDAVCANGTGEITFSVDVNSVASTEYKVEIEVYGEDAAVSVSGNSVDTELGAAPAGEYVINVLVGAALDTDVTYSQMDGDATS